jgi:hypothetical protein
MTLCFFPPHETVRSAVSGMVKATDRERALGGGLSSAMGHLALGDGDGEVPSSRFSLPCVNSNDKDEHRDNNDEQHDGNDAHCDGIDVHCDEFDEHHDDKNNCGENYEHSDNNDELRDDNDDNDEHCCVASFDILWLQMRYLNCQRQGMLLWERQEVFGITKLTRPLSCN